tara:strand:- start:1302 stop:1634 length:333 start_codon:yes stop_codon:yes gene_type:complete
MTKWNPKVAEEMSLLIKDWLKQNGKTQAELRERLNSESSRMSSLLETLEKESSETSLYDIAYKLCKIEDSWHEAKEEGVSLDPKDKSLKSDPFAQLDLLINEINEDCDRE